MWKRDIPKIQAKKCADIALNIWRNISSEMPNEKKTVKEDYAKQAIFLTVLELEAAHAEEIKMLNDDIDVLLETLSIECSSTQTREDIAKLRIALQPQEKSDISPVANGH
jgi:hypothetical protein